MGNKLRRRLLLLVLIAQVVTVLALVFTTGQVSNSAEEDLTERLLSSSAAESAEAVNNHLQPAEELVNLTASLLSTTDTQAATLDATFRQALRETSQLSGVFVGSVDGDFAFVNRDGENVRFKLTEVDGDERSTEIHIFDADGEILDSFLDPDDVFDPTVRPWFQQAIEQPGEAVWTDPYIFFTSQQLGITVARAVEVDGEIVGVVGADIELGALSELLADLDVATGGGTILVDQSSTVIAHPNTDLLRVPDDDGFRTVSILEFEDSYARSATAVLLEAGDTTDSVVYNFDDEIVGESQVSFESVEFGDVEWTLGVFAPDGAIVEELVIARERSRVLQILVGSLAILGALLVAYPATRDIETLNERASSDALTGLPNRRSIMAATAEFADAEQARSLAILDVDHFKLVNDTYGHPIGDQVLIAVAERLQAQLPEDSEIGRIGGEEFLILMPAHNEESAQQVAERLRLRVSNHPVETTAGEIPVSVSIGIVSTTEPVSREWLLSEADSALRDAKESGRDAVVMRLKAG